MISRPAYRLTIRDDALGVTQRRDGETVFTYDRAGRLFAAWRHQRFYRRALNGRIVEKQTAGARPSRVVHRRTLDVREADGLIADASEAARAAADALGAKRAEMIWSASGPASPEAALRLVGAAAAFDPAAAREDARRYAEVYRPVGILPPDQYLALVLQVTEGCRWNRCTFCTFYRDEPFRVKPLAELAAHLQQVVAYFGEGASLRRALFLGEANALCLPTEELVPRLELIRRWFPPDGGPARRMHAFLDVFTGRRKSAAEFAALRERGLERVYVGVESGDDALLRWLNKPQRGHHAAEVVQTLKAAGLVVGVILMAGVGGDRFAASHVEASRALLAALPLDARDLVYLSAFVEHPHSDYERAAREAGIHPLDPPALRAQLRALHSGLRGLPGRPRVARYDIAEFLY